GEPGDPARNTGLIVLVAPQERRWKIEVGLGTNTFITASEAGRIGREQMVPAFQQEDYGLGILRGVTALAMEYAERFGFELTGEIPAEAQPQSGGGGGGGPGIFTWVVIAVILLILFSGRRGGGGRGGGGGPGGRGGGGRRRYH